MKTFVVAEIGINHNGNINVTKRLIQGAKKAGADFVKFQTFWCFDKLREYEFTKNQWTEIFAYCYENDIEWFSTPFDKAAVDFLNSRGMEIWKIPSNAGVVNNPQLLGKIAKAKNRKITIISTGISDDCSIKWLLQFFDDKPHILLHCISEYPAPIKSLNLRRIKYLEQRFNCPVGFSDHSLSITAPLEAVKLCAQVIEKHITLDRNGKGPDHKASLIPGEFKQMVKYIREHEVL